MSDFVIAPPAQVAVPGSGGGSGPVRRSFCSGRNDPEHAREMGHDPQREPPSPIGDIVPAARIG